MDSDGLENRFCKGRLLVSEPSLADSNFRCTVVLVAEHDEKGAFGLVVNRPGGQAVADLWNGLTGEPCSSQTPVYIGGPVERAAVFILHNREDLHRPEELPEFAEPVVEGPYMGCPPGPRARIPSGLPAPQPPYRLPVATPPGRTAPGGLPRAPSRQACGGPKCTP